MITTVFTGGAGGAVATAGKVGAAAKALSIAGKAGRFVDPMTYVFKGAGAGLSKIGDVIAGLKGMGRIDIPHSQQPSSPSPKARSDSPTALSDSPRAQPSRTVRSGSPTARSNSRTA
ncbi:hypothetical protein NKH18_17860 [Streptomyces sp. M10(2022)]